MMSRVSAVAALVFVWTVACASDRARSADLGQRLDATIDNALADGRIVGTVVIVMRDGNALYHRAAGFSDGEMRLPMSENTIFRLASSSKAITSAAAMALIDHGLLSLDDPVTRWLPGFKPSAPDGSTPVITVRQLLTHTAGLTYPFWEPKDGAYRRARVSSGLDQPGVSMLEELRRIKLAGLAYVPGSQWRYSLSIDVLGAVIAEADHKPLAAAVRELITGPLNMRDTGFSVADRGRLATPYFNSRPLPQRMSERQEVMIEDNVMLSFSPSRIFDPVSFPSGGAGMVGTAGDFLRFLEAMRTGGGPVLKPATVKAMMTNQVGDMPVLSGPGWGFGYGAAVMIDAAAAKSPLPLGSWSWSGIYGTSWFLDPVNGFCVVAFTNTAPEGDSGPFAMQIRTAVYGASQK